MFLRILGVAVLGAAMSLSVAGPASAADRTCVVHTVTYATNVGCISWSDGTLDYTLSAEDANGDRFNTDFYVEFLAADGSRIRADNLYVRDFDGPQSRLLLRPATATRARLVLCAGWMLSDDFPYFCAGPRVVDL